MASHAVEHSQLAAHIKIILRAFRKYKLLLTPEVYRVLLAYVESIRIRFLPPPNHLAALAHNTRCPAQSIYVLLKGALGLPILVADHPVVARSLPYAETKVDLRIHMNLSSKATPSIRHSSLKYKQQKSLHHLENPLRDSEGSRSPLNSRTTQGIRNPLKRLAVKRTGGGATESHLGWPAVTDKN